MERGAQRRNLSPRPVQSHVGTVAGAHGIDHLLIAERKNGPSVTPNALAIFALEEMEGEHLFFWGAPSQFATRSWAEKSVRAQGPAKSSLLFPTENESESKSLFQSSFPKLNSDPWLRKCRSLSIQRSYVGKPHIRLLTSI